MQIMSVLLCVYGTWHRYAIETDCAFLERYRYIGIGSYEAFLHVLFCML